ncbi:hypothetical protein [Methylobacterium nigriterrae]|uniref:hypothetical protein n=1 Tax=Methylobacterium nigriterrae TaxID=3127512 RepID=UPI0030134543
MTTDELPRGYAIEVYPVARPAGQFGWAIRKHGKLYERSDFTFPTEQKAYAKALEAVERDARGEVQRDRR